MIETNRGDNGNVRVNNIHRIQTTTKADFENQQVRSGTPEQPQCRQRGELEIGQCDVTARRFHCLESTTQPGVINGASELLGEIFGDAGAHARSAVGVSELPRNAPVEVEVIVEVA